MAITPPSATVARSHRLTILTSLAYLAVEAEQCGDQSLAAHLRSAFMDGIGVTDETKSGPLGKSDVDAILDFLLGFLAADPQLQDAIVTCLDRQGGVMRSNLSS